MSLRFDLIGFGGAGSLVSIDVVEILTGQVPPPLAFTLTPDSDSGVPGNDTTNQSQVGLVGITDPNRAVSLDQDGDGFDDGTILADDAGRFIFENVPLQEGENEIRLLVGNDAGQTIRSRIVRLDREPPRVEAIVVNEGAVQRSMVTSIEIRFSEDVSAGLTAAALVLSNLTSETMIAADAMEVTYDAESDTATWTFPGLTGASLPDGNYLSRLLGDAVADAAGNLLDGNENGEAGGDRTFEFFRYFGDTDADRDVDFFDTFRWSRTYRKTSGDEGFNPALDHNRACPPLSKTLN